MNILREVRRVKNKSLATRIILILLFCVILIINTYAWLSTQVDVSVKGFHGDVTSWDVSYYVNANENQILDQTAIFTIEDLYPGMPLREDRVHIYNLGEASTDIEYEIISVKVFGQEVLSQLDIKKSGNTVSIFSADSNYPFNVSYTYDKDYLQHQYIDDTTTPEAHATFKFNVNWAYEGQGAADEKLAKDILDTQFGKQAYAYYKDSANDPSKAIEIQIKIRSNMIHPSLEE